MESKMNDEGLRSSVIGQLRDLGCCDLCILRYIGNTEPQIYRRDQDYITKILGLNEGNGVPGNDADGTQKIKEEAHEPVPKLLRTTPCVACLGLLDPNHGTSESVLEKIATAVKESGIQAKSYTINLSLPISVQFRAHFIWYHLVDKFPTIYESFANMKPEGTCLKNAWKWICSGKLREKVDPDSDWGTEGCLTINISWKYKDEETECQSLNRQIKNSMDKRKSDSLTKNGVQSFFSNMSSIEFKRKFGDNPPTASNFLLMDEIHCIHIPIYVAGRYCKYSRKVSQTPWIMNGKRFHDGSVEELISEQVLLMLVAEQDKFSSSGREDVDVRMLGLGRPFVMEVINPRRTLFTQQDLNALKNKINNGTSMISVRDLQIVDRKDASKLKEGEEFKTKTYCALCRLPDGEVTPEIIEKLNNVSLPLVLQQNTPLRVLHRRSLAIRERSIYSIKATPGKSKNLFKLRVQTQAGTYVKEFVHGDMGRTKPSIAEILECDADIVSLDVESVDFAWPPSIDD